MKRLTTIATILLICLASKADNAGAWRMYPSYTSVEDVINTGSRTYVLASGNLYSYDTDASGQALTNTLTTYTKADVLHDAGISCIAWSETAQSLIIAYRNGNIDILAKDGTATCVPDYYLKPTLEDRTFTGIGIDGNSAYLYTAKQTLSIDVSNATISFAKGTPVAPRKANAATPALRPQGPADDLFYYAEYNNGTLYTVKGFVSYGFSVECNYDGEVQHLDVNTGEWTKFDDSFVGSLGHIYQDHNDIAIDPRNGDHIFVSGKTGVYEFLDGKYVNCWNYTNTGNAIQSYNDKSLNRNIVLSMEYDAEGNLWMVNSRSTKPVVKYSSTGEWSSYAIDGFPKKDDGTDLQSMNVDRYGKLWFADAHWFQPAVYCYDPVSGNARIITKLYAEDGCTTYEPDRFFSVLEDSYGNIIITTTNGAYVIDKDDVRDIVSNSGNDRITVTSLDNLVGLANILHATKDHAGNLWFSTDNNGLFVVNKKFTHTLLHFTKDNSPLPCDDISNVTFDYDHNTVYICTSKGLCSYQTDIISNDTGIVDGKVTVSPNPVTPEYTGDITISGLEAYAGNDITILSPEGDIVEEGTVNGDSYTWHVSGSDDKDILSGVYKVYTNTKNSDRKKFLARISIIR